jgi:hypothetical protein
MPVFFGAEVLRAEYGIDYVPSEIEISQDNAREVGFSEFGFCRFPVFKVRNA